MQDTNFTLDERSPGVTNRRRIYSTGDVDAVANALNEGSVTAATPADAMPAKSAAAATPVTPAASQAPLTIRVANPATITEEEDRPKPPNPTEIPPRRRKTSAPPRFCFFDYSMIPDKDPRWDSNP